MDYSPGSNTAQIESDAAVRSECIDLYDVKGVVHDHSDLGSHTFASGSLRHP